MLRVRATGVCQAGDRSRSTVEPIEEQAVVTDLQADLKAALQAASPVAL